MKVIESINLGLHQAFSENKNVLMLGEDLLDPYGGAFKASKGLSTKYPDRIITTPVSEAGIVGVGAGLALRGFRPVVEIMFGDFIMLASDQIINHISKFQWMYNDQVSVPIVIRAPMGGRRGYGPTHSQSLEKQILGTPCLKVIALNQVYDPGEILRQAILNEKQPVIAIENKTIYPQELLQSSQSDWNVQHTQDRYPTSYLCLGDFENPQVTVISYGGSTQEVMNAVFQLFMDDETVVEIINLSSLQPIPIEDLKDSIKKTGSVLIVEEGTESYGIGAEISALIYEHFFSDLKKPVKRLGALNLPIGNSPVLENATLPQKQQIITAIKQLLI